MLKRARAIPLAALALFLAAGLGAFALEAGAALKTQEERDYGEGIVLWQAANVTDWRKAFHPVENYPHIVFHYPPLYHLTARLVAPATGNLLVAGRLTSILSLLGSCLVMASLAAACLPPARRPAARWLGAFSAGTLIFTTPVWTWAYTMRVDTLGVFLSITGVALFVAARRRPALAFLSCVCFVAAVYTKQTMVAAPAACFLLAFVEKPRRALYLVAFTVAAGLLTLLVLQTLTGGMFLRHVVGYNQNPFLLRHVFSRWIDHLSKLPALLVVIAVMFPVALFARRAGGASALLKRIRLALCRSAFERCAVAGAIYFWLAVAVVTVTIGKKGANFNYFFEVDIAACLLSGLFLGWLIRRASFRPRGAHALLTSLVIPLFLLHSVSNFTNLYQGSIKFFRPAYDYSADVVRLVRETPGPVYSEDMTILMRAGKEIPAEPAIITALALNNRWDESSFVRRIEEGQFQAIIARSLDDRDRFTQPVARAVQQRYSLNRELGPYKIYLPK
ncbi:MAG TPA: hypothetical protein VF538_15640 [Pyrinomonadaceae bacterium]|jgi:hypothetical protein